MPKPTRNVNSIESSTGVEKASTIVEEVRVLLIPTEEGTSKVTKSANAEPVVIIVQEPLLAMTEPSAPPPPENVP